MSFIFLLFIIAIFILLLIPTIIFSVIRTLLSILGFSLRGRKRGGSSSARGYSHGADNGDRGSYTKYGARDNDSSRKKMFDKDEGEYVDFEEIKDE
ncbi:MAG: DUF4834 family protein [Bacteroidaceae bacterium]|nr:DUF4834 family protein [Bacteroidaceae bacterium]